MNRPRQPYEEPSHICTDDWCLVSCENCGCDLCLEEPEINDRWIDDMKLCDKCIQETS